jgi:molybdopterin converting factor small subunit
VGSGRAADSPGRIGSRGEGFVGGFRSRKITRESVGVAKVRIRLPSHIARMLEPGTSGWLELEKEVGAETTVSELLSGLVLTHPGFRQWVFNPDVGVVNEQVNVVLNDELLTFAEISQTRLADGDTLGLLPIYSGG